MSAVLDHIDTTDPTESSAPRTRWWMAAGLLFAAVALLLGVVAVMARDDTGTRPVSAPELRWVIDDSSYLAYGATEQQPLGTPDMWPGDGPVKYALYGTHDDPSQPTVSMAAGGDYVNYGGFAFLTGVTDLQRKVADGVEAACGNWVYGFQLCMAEVNGSFVQAHARGIATAALVDLMLHVQLKDGGPVLDEAALPSGMSLLHAWDTRPPGPISRIDPDAVSTVVSFDRSDGYGPSLTVGWADQQELAAAFESAPYAPKEVGGITYFVSTESVFGGSRVVWEQDDRAFDLSMKGTPEEALALARTVRPATEAEWAAAVVAQPAAHPLPTTTTVEGATTTTMGNYHQSVVSLPPGTVVTDVPVSLQVEGDGAGEVDFTSELPDGTTSTMSGLLAGDTAFMSFDGGAPTASWTMQPPLLFEYSSDSPHMGLFVLNTDGTAAQLRVTRGNGERYVMDLVPFPGSDGVTVAYLAIPSNELVTADVVDGFGRVLDHIGL